MAKDITGYKRSIDSLICGAVTDLLYDNRVDDSIPVGAIEEWIREEYITVDEMVELFRERLVAGIKANE